MFKIGLSKEAAQILGSRLQERNLLSPETKFAWYRHREQEFREYFCKVGSLVYCQNIRGLIEHMGVSYRPTEWRLFIDASKRSLKAVLLSNGNKLASIPIGHSVHMTETYDNMKLLLRSIKYEDHDWLICGDLKVIAIILGMQGGYTKYPCFMCKWDSRADDEHYERKVWPAREELTPGLYNIKAIPLVNPIKVLLPPLHIKLGIMKNFVKALPPDGSAYRYLVEHFPQLSDAKIKAGVFVGPQIRDLMKDAEFEKTLVHHEKSVWLAFKLLVSNFFGKSPIIGV